MNDPFSFTHVIPTLVNSRRLSSNDRETWEAITTGALVAVHKHWYLPKDTATSLAWYEKRALHAYAVGKSANAAVLVGRSAARMLGIWTFSLGAEKAEVAYRHGGAPGNQTRSAGVHYYYTKLRPEVITQQCGVDVTTPLRTVIDICLYHGFLEGLMACDWALKHGFKREDLRRELQRCGRRRGVKNARRAIRHATHLSDSAPESLARGLLIQAGFEDIIPQYRVGDYWVDLLVNGFLVIEVDGDGKYKNDKELADQLRKERQREKYLQKMGYWVIRFRPYEVMKNPDAFIREVHAALEARARNQEVVRRAG